MAKPGAVYAVDPKAFFFFFLGGTKENETHGSCSVVTIEGPLDQKGGFFFDSYDQIQQRFQEALDDKAAKAVVLKIDSPGGDCAGLMECVKAMRAAKEAAGKPVYAYADELAASAAYALATVADEIYMPPSGGVGSIGVIAMMFEQTKRDRKDGFVFEVVASGKRKPDGNSHIEISDEARARLTKRVDELAVTFFELVADRRELDVDAVRGLEADVLYGQEAVKKGLADGLLSFSEVLEQAQDASSTSPAPQGRKATTEGKNTMNLLALRKAKKDAEAKLAAAKSAAAKKTAKAELDAAIKALAEAEAKLAAAAAMRESRAAERRCERCGRACGDAKRCDICATSSEDSSSAEDDDESAEEDCEDEDEEDDEEEGDDEDAEDEDSEEESSSAKGSSHHDALVAAALEVTGKSDPREAIGALRGMKMASDRLGVVEKQIGELRRDKRREKVRSLVEAAIKDGRLTPAQRDAYTRIGMRDTKELKGLLDTMPKRVRMDDDGALREQGSAQAGELTEREREIVTRAGAADLYEQAKKDGKLLPLSAFLGDTVH